MVEFPERLPLANAPTPLHLLESISDKVGTKIWIKRDDLTESACSGNKIRKLEFTLARARQQGCDTIVTCGGVQSNHCRSTAILGARLGFKVDLLLRGDEPDEVDGNLFLDHLAGATTHFFASKYFAAHQAFIVSETMEGHVEKGRKPYYIPIGASDGLGVWGYLKAAEEIRDQADALGVHFDHIISATGSGGTQAGLTLGNYLYDLKATVTGYAVCDNADYFQDKVAQDISDWCQESGQHLDVQSLGINTNDHYIGAGYAKASEAVFNTIAEMAQLEGIILDPVYTGKAFHGLLTDIQSGKLQADNLLFVHTGGIYGLFAQRPEALSAV